MYIKQVIIQGFRSYRDQTVVEPFSSKHNIIVGRNGSGKSNFFYAIQFVLSDEFSHLRQEQRQALLHEGTGARVISAFVEIIFDNSDNRIPIDKDEVSLRRVIGSKKDQYFLDKKMVTKTDVMNLLESAGFSRSNPYYIVKQGKINQMATAPDSARLKLLREVAGTRVYDERKEESRGILKDTEGKREKISELLKYIDDRLAALEGEKEELRQYQKLDKMKRSLEYTIHDKELKETRKKLEELTEKRDDLGKETQKMRDDLTEAQEEIKRTSRELKELKTRVKGSVDEKDSLSGELGDLIKKRSKLELQIQDMKSEIESNDQAKKEKKKKIEDINSDIAKTQAKLDDITPKYDDFQRKEDRASQDLALSEQKRKELYAKQGRTSQFASKEERDKWINRELKSLTKNIRDKTDQIARLKQEITDNADRLPMIEAEMVDINEKIINHKEIIDKNNKDFYELKKKKDTFQEKRSTLMRDETTSTSTLDTVRDELAGVESGLRSLTGKSVLNGIDSVQKVLQTFRDQNRHKDVIDGYHGLLIENFEVDRTFFTAVEVTAGSRLFFHLVETDKVGTVLLKEINQRRLPGEVNLMPLNKLDARDTEYPDSQDAISMLSKLNYNPKFDGCMKHCFGKTLICRSMEVASQFARTWNLDGITLDGDQVSRRGALTGGYYDRSRSRLELQNRKIELLEKLETQEKDFRGNQDVLAKLETEINSGVAEMQKLETKMSRNKETYDRLRSDLKSRKDEQSSLQRSREGKEKSLTSLESSLESMKASEESLRHEMGTDLMAQLSVEDQHKVDELTDKIRLLTKESKEVLRERIKLESEKNRLENKLNNNLMKQRDRFTKELDELTTSKTESMIDAMQAELEEVDDKVTEKKIKMQNIESGSDGLSGELKDLQKTLDDWKQKERSYQERINDEAKELEKISSKQGLLLKKKEEAMKKIRDLGSLPSDAFDKYQNTSLKQLFSKLEKCNDDLKKYSHVNKKALDQFVNFSDQKEKLLKRKDELDRAHSSIVELMQVLEQRKYEAIQLTFKQVSKHFAEVFKKLVPQGSGTLVMRRDESSVEDDDEGTNKSKTVDLFSGVGIKVSFTGKQAEMREMNQLSGGQKSLVALTLIFAIQKCDPAPFYLFDEIDQALDAQHRKSVADLILEQADEAQFITTTFRPELLESGDKFYGVKFRNKVSHIECVGKEEAADFVEDDSIQK